LKTAVRCRYIDQQAAAFTYLALLAGQKNHRDLQLNYLNRALSLLHPKRLSPLYLLTLLDRGYLYCGLRKFIPAQLDAESALNLATRRSETSYIAIASLLLGKIFRDRPRPDLTASTEYLNDAHRLIYQNRMGQVLWEVEFDRGLLAKKKGEALRARNYFLSSQNELEAFLKGLPESIRQNYLRDRKLERIAEELKALET
jgi:hypothetical protein